MAVNNVSETVERRCTIKFLEKEKLDAAEIMRRLQAQHMVNK